MVPHRWCASRTLRVTPAGSITEQPPRSKKRQWRHGLSSFVGTLFCQHADPVQRSSAKPLLHCTACREGAAKGTGAPARTLQVARNAVDPVVAQVQALQPRQLGEAL